MTGKREIKIQGYLTNTALVICQGSNSENKCSGSLQTESKHYQGKKLKVETEAKRLFIF